VFAVFALVNQPDIHAVAVGVDSEFLCVSEMGLSATAGTAPDDTKGFCRNDFIFNF